MPVSQTTITSESHSSIERVRHELPLPFVWFLILKEFALLPGTILHETTHYLSSLVLGLEVYDWRFLDESSGFTSGYFEVERPRTYGESVAFNLAPLSLLLVAPVVFSLSLGASGLWSVLVIWVGLSVTARALPSWSDFANIESHAGRSSTRGVLPLAVSKLKHVSVLQLFGGDVALGILLYWMVSHVA